MQGEGRKNLYPCNLEHGFFCPGSRYSDKNLASWFRNAFPGFLDSIRDLIFREAGHECVSGLVLSGSFASGEGTVMMLGREPHFLSDIDLLLIVGKRECHASLLNRRVSIGKACEDLLAEAHFLGRVDIGVMTEGELPSMPMSPGVYDMKRKGILLCGEQEVLDILPVFGAEEIGCREAIRLIDNRGAAFLGYIPETDNPDGVDLSIFLYGLSRVYTDIVTAVLSSRRQYLPGYGQRAQFLSDSEEAAGARDQLGDRLVRAIERWTSFKIDPVISDVWDSDYRARHLWLEAASDLLAVREQICCDMCKEADREDMFKSEDRIRMIDSVRAWKAAASGLGKVDLLRLAFRTRITGMGPEEYLRDESVRLLRQAVAEGTGGIASAAPAGYPHGRISWERAASLTYAAWNRLVTGREGETIG